MGTEVNEHGKFVAASGADQWVPSRNTSIGERLMTDWLMYRLMKGQGYQVRAGTVATGVAMDSTVTDTDAELCVDAASGLTIIPIRLGMSFDDIATATTVRVHLKAVGTASNAGTVFDPLPLLQGGAAGSASGRVDPTGVVQVVGEVATLSTPLTATKRLFTYNNVHTETPTSALPGAAAGALATIAASAAELRYVGKGVSCIYLQAASTTAFPLYFAELDFIEFDSDELP